MAPLKWLPEMAPWNGSMKWFPDMGYDNKNVNKNTNTWIIFKNRLFSQIQIKLKNIKMLKIDRFN